MVKIIPAAQTSQVLVQITEEALANQILVQTIQIVEAAQTTSHLTHTWVNVTKTVNHPAETHQEDVYENRQVKVKDAWDEKVWVKTLNVCNQCGYSTTSGSAMDEHLLEYGHSSSSKDIYETVHHDAVYETQRVKVGTKTVTDKAAWTETVVTGQKCSFCGETKTN